MRSIFLKSHLSQKRICDGREQGPPACIVHWREVREPDEWRYPHDSLPDRLRGKR